MITQDQVKELFHYRNGELFWKTQPYKSHFDISKPAGYVGSRGYRNVMIESRGYPAHRIVFLFHKGYLPKFLDHVNNNRVDNRIENIREATRSQNNRNAKLGKNNTSGVKGVNFCKQTGKWRAQIRVTGKHLTIGRYSCIKEAQKAIIAKRKELHGEWANNG